MAKTLSEIWDEFEAQVLSETTNPEKKEAIQNTFYAAAGAVWTQLVSCDTSEELFGLMASYAHELNAYTDKALERAQKKNPHENSG